MTQEVRIMVVDDETPVLESLKMILKIKDYDVTIFEKGKEAISSMEKNKYDICFIDQWLKKDEEPFMGPTGGIEVLKKIKEIDPDIEVILVTAYAQEHNMSLQAITLGAMEYLRKPFMMEEIYELADRALRKRREKGIKKGPIQPPPSIH